MTVRTLKTKDLQAGMKVVEPIMGKKGQRLVNKNEVLTGGHIEKLNKWNGRKDKSGAITNSVDAANPRGIQIESTLKTPDALPNVVNNPEKSPLIEVKAKGNLGKSVTVGVNFDKQGNIIRDEDSNADDPGVEPKEEPKKEEVKVESKTDTPETPEPKLKRKRRIKKKQD